jgi:hypothetical protein
VLEHSIFETAVEFVNNTSRSIFLTGKAGTGKTTFLRYIRENTPKKTIVVAPTGVAAINAGGVTMHSMFQLPLGPYIPAAVQNHADSATDKYSLFKNLRLSQEKRDIIRDVDLIIIDEVSMVRSDTLDAMDAILRYVRRRPNKVFGGAQILFIGDLLQLPPVMPEQEWSMLREYYKSPYFFDSNAAKQCDIVYLELKKIFRQSDPIFIEILNRIRNADPTDEDLRNLNNRLNSNSAKNKDYITLTSHNYKADRINQEELRKLPGKVFEYSGAIEGDFPEKILPTEVTLSLKVGAQVMFIRNDKSSARRYFNGKLATISRIDKEGVFVNFKDDQQEFLLEKESWENIKYNYNTSERKIEEEKIGSFSQYPIRLAWAITIHKSQGLTFDNVIIDAGDSFASGQVYVALSRCRSLDGIVLTSPLVRKNISTDALVLEFAGSEKKVEQILDVLEQEKEIFANSQLLETFSVSRLKEAFNDHHSYIKQKLDSNKAAVVFAMSVLSKITKLENVSAKFQAELEGLLREKQHERIHERLAKAIEYFLKFFKEEVVGEIDAHLDAVKKIKKTRKYQMRIHALRNAVVAATKIIRAIAYRGHSFAEIEVDEIKEIPLPLRHGKPKKGESMLETLRMIRLGKTLKEVSADRALAISTIEAHCTQLIAQGKLDVYQIISKEKVDEIQNAMTKSQSASVSYLKGQLGAGFSFGEISAVVAHVEFQKAS